MSAAMGNWSAFVDHGAREVNGRPWHIVADGAMAEVMPWVARNGMAWRSMARAAALCLDPPSARSAANTLPSSECNAGLLTCHGGPVIAHRSNTCQVQKKRQQSHAAMLTSHGSPVVSHGGRHGPLLLRGLKVVQVASRKLGASATLAEQCGPDGQRPTQAELGQGTGEGWRGEQPSQLGTAGWVQRACAWHGIEVGGQLLPLTGHQTAQPALPCSSGLAWTACNGRPPASRPAPGGSGRRPAAPAAAPRRRPGCPRRAALAPAAASCSWSAGWPVCRLSICQQGRPAQSGYRFHGSASGLPPARSARSAARPSAASTGSGRPAPRA